MNLSSSFVSSVDRASYPLAFTAFVNDDLLSLAILKKSIHMIMTTAMTTYSVVPLS